MFVSTGRDWSSHRRHGRGSCGSGERANRAPWLALYAEDNGQCLRKDMISITSAQTAEWRSRRSKLHLVGVALGEYKGADPVRDKRAIIDGYVSKQFSDVVV